MSKFQYHNIMEHLSTHFMPHGHCYFWRPEILWVHVLSDSLIAISYFLIPFLLFRYAVRRPDMPFKGIFTLFAVFIFSCGISHIFSIWVIWNPDYTVQGYIKAITGFASIATVIMLFKVFHNAIHIPSPYQIKLANQDLSLMQSASHFSPNGLVITDIEGFIVFSNPAVSQIFGYDMDELIGQNINILVPPNIQANHTLWVQKFVAAGGTHLEINAGRALNTMNKVGQTIQVEVKINSHDFQGKTHLFASINNVSDREESHSTIYHLNQKFKRILSASDEWIWEYNLNDGQFWLIQDASDFEQLQTHSIDYFYNLVSQHHRSELRSLINDSIINGTPIDTKLQIETNGQRQWVSINAINHFNENSETGIISGRIQNIHALVEANLKIENQNKFLESIYENVSLGIFVIDVIDGEFYLHSMNHVSRNLLSLPNNKNLYQNIKSLAPEHFSKEVVDAICKNYQVVVDTKSKFNYEEEIPVQGRNTYWTTYLNPILNSEGSVCQIIGSALEISSLKITQRELEASNEFNTQLHENSISGVYIYSLEENSNIYINTKYTELTGYTLDDLNNIEDFSSLFHPEDLETVFKHMKVLQDSKPGSVYKLEYRFKTKNGNYIWCLSQDIVTKRDNQGNALEFLGSFVDISELKTINKKLMTSNAELERFAYAASHDLQEPLRKISAFSDILFENLPIQLNEDARYAQSKIKDGTQRMSDLITGILNISKATTAEFDLKYYSPKSQFTEICSHAPCQFLPNESLDNIQIFADDNWMQNVFENIIANSIKYFKGEGLVEIYCDAQINNDTVTLSISDNGSGVAKDKLETIFEAFKRLENKSAIPGSGIGLALCKQIIHAHQGEMKAEIATSGGLKIVIELPGRKL